MRTRLLATFVAVLCSSGRAVADGAFPDELTVMLPEKDPDPDRILLGTNFGLVISPDAGKSWRYVCEPYITDTLSGSVADTVIFYQAASDGSAVIAVSLRAFWRTTDGGCTWTRATGTVAPLFARDAFIDPNDPSFVLGIAANFDLSMDSIEQSVDGGATFQKTLYPTPNRLTGIEIARSSPSVMYATELHDTSINAAQAFLVTSVDHGQTWNRVQLVDASVPSGTDVSIAAVDPVDASKVYLRLINVVAGTDSIAVTSDQGHTLSPPQPFTIPGPTAFSAFLTAADGTLFAGTTSSDLYAAPAGSIAFVKRTGPRARCLGQRPGDPRNPIYACGDGLLDGYNLGISTDGAQTFTPLMKFTDIAGPLTCPAVAQACAAQFAALQQTLGVPPPPPPAPPGGGTNPAPKPGCGSAGGQPSALLGLLALARAFRFRGRRGRAAHSGATLATSSRAVRKSRASP